MKKLNCRGIGVVIDDKVPFVDEDCCEETGNNQESGGTITNNSKASNQDCIVEIVRQLKADGISLLRYRELPSSDEWENFDNVAFLLVDWALINPKVALEGGKKDEDDSSSEVDVNSDAMVEQICDFIKSVHSRACSPVFVFSNQDDTEIKGTLSEHGIAVDGPGAYVLVRPKEKMVELDKSGTPRLFNEINSWICATPTIYLLTTWGRDVLAARNQMFAEFYGKSHNWPLLLWNAYTDDNNPAQELSQVMFDNLKARVRCDLSDMPKAIQGETAGQALMDVLALTVMLPDEALPKGQIGCGDLFEIAPDTHGARYHLIVSCDCDCVLRKEQNNSEKQETDNEKKYIQVLEVSHPMAANDSEITKRISRTRGIKHMATESYLFPLYGRCFKVPYQTLSLILREDFDFGKRKGRILPPYITDIRQRLAQWNQRVGFPKLPPELFG